jgi:hypothetical protein
MKETTILNIAEFRLIEPSSEHLLDVHKHLFLHFGVTHVDQSTHFPHSTLRLRMEVPCDDDVDALVEWEKAQDTVYNAYMRTEEILWGVKRNRDLIWTPCKHR